MCEAGMAIAYNSQIMFGLPVYNIIYSKNVKQKKNIQ